MGPTNRDHGRPESVARGAHKLANFALPWGENDYKTVLSGANLYAVVAHQTCDKHDEHEGGC